MHKWGVGWGGELSYIKQNYYPDSSKPGSKSLGESEGEGGEDLCSKLSIPVLLLTASFRQRFHTLWLCVHRKSLESYSSKIDMVAEGFLSPEEPGAFG